MWPSLVRCGSRRRIEISKIEWEKVSTVRDRSKIIVVRALLINLGSIGNLASAVSVAASSFDMKVTSPKSFLDELDMDRVRKILGNVPESSSLTGPTYVEPNGSVSTKSWEEGQVAASASETTSSDPPVDAASQKTETSDIISSKIQRLGDFIDTDAVSK